MNNRIYAMDTHFMCANEGPSIEEQAKIVKDAGYDGYYVTARTSELQKIKDFVKASKDAGLEFTSMLTFVELDDELTDEAIQGYADTIDQLDSSTILEITITKGGFTNEGMGDESHDDTALEWLKRITELADAKGIQIALYPHFGFWLETVSDGLRLAKKLNNPNVGVILTSYHWYRVKKEGMEIFDEAAPYLKSVNLCGSRHWENEEDVANGMNPSIEPIDAGTKDIEAIFAKLKEINFTGAIGIQGYGVNAPAKEALDRSIAKAKELMA